MKTAKSIVIVMYALLTVQTASAYYCPSTGRWLSRDPMGELGFQALQIASQTSIKQTSLPSSDRWIIRDSIGKRSLGAISGHSMLARSDESNRYLFVQNDTISSIDPLGLKIVDTGIKTCFYPIHWYIRITGGAAYGLHPTGSKIGSPGEIDNEDQDFPDDVKHEGCANVQLDDCAYDINKFKKCVLIKIQQGIAHPAYFNVVAYNCTSWVNEVLDDCEEFAKKK